MWRLAQGRLTNIETSTKGWSSVYYGDLQHSVEDGRTSFQSLYTLVVLRKPLVGSRRNKYKEAQSKGYPIIIMFLVRIPNMMCSPCSMCALSSCSQHGYVVLCISEVRGIQFHRSQWRQNTECRCGIYRARGFPRSRDAARLKRAFETQQCLYSERAAVVLWWQKRVG